MNAFKVFIDAQNYAVLEFPMILERCDQEMCGEMCRLPARGQTCDRQQAMGDRRMREAVFNLVANRIVDRPDCGSGGVNVRQLGGVEASLPATRWCDSFLSELIAAFPRSVQRPLA